MASRSGKQSLFASRLRRLHIEPLEDRRLLTITVDTLVDEADGSIADGDISLRDAIAAASSGETIDFAVTGTIHLDDSLGELRVTKSLTIAGPGDHLLTVNAGDGPDNNPGTSDGYRIFNIDGIGSQIPVEISGMTLTGGDPNGVGGAIRSIEQLTVSGVHIFGNFTPISARGGGIYNV